MYVTLPESTGNVLGYALEGRLTEEEVEEIQQQLADVLEAHGSARMLIRADHLHGVEPTAVWQDLRMTPEYVTKLDRIAVVGDARWQKWLATISDLVTEAAFFAPEEIDRAWGWVRAQDEGGHAR
jgi:hypothetical protein